MQFAQVIGQDHLRDNLTDMVRRNRLSHALLFLGHEGAGALPMALAFAQYVVCENKGADACGVCSACVKAGRLVHPDIHFTAVPG